MIEEPKLADLRPRFQHALEFAQAQVRNLIDEHPRQFPHVHSEWKMGTWKEKPGRIGARVSWAA